MRTIRRVRSAGERGYSLAEMLTVVAIIGALSLFIVPNFISMYRQNKLKTSIRQFANDLRAARQRAVTKSSTVRVSFGHLSRTYLILESSDEGASWQHLGTNPKYVDPTAYFVNDDGADKFTDTIDDTIDDFDYGNLEDIVFERTGVARVPTGKGIVRVRSQHTDIAIPTYKVTVGSAGTVSVN